MVDDLTGLLNRRGWRYTAPRELARAARSGNPITLVTLDLDNFKELNDEHGHEQGDRALRTRPSGSGPPCAPATSSPVWVATSSWRC